MKPKHGGKRPGAGRKPVPDAAMKSIKLSDAHWEKAKRIGQGNGAAGIRLAIDEYPEESDENGSALPI